MQNYERTKLACFISCASTAITGNISPLLFLSFMRLYGISYTLLGFLVVINFGTQLLFDLVFSFFSPKFNLQICSRLAPLLGGLGLILFGLAPTLFPNNVYAGLALGTIVFSCGGGLAEVFSSPIVAALPSKNPERLMGALHSCYAWGVVAVVFITVGYLELFGEANWQMLAVAFSVFPIIAFVMFLFSPIPDISSESGGADGGALKNKTLWLCVLAIFLGGATECTMSQWCSSYLEQAFGIPKSQGDIFGVALFGAMLGLGRSMYAKFGKRTEDILFFGSFFAFLCYVGAVAFSAPTLGMLACAFTGFFAAMLWPGSLIVTQSLVPDGGLAMFAIMAAGGDMGASLVPQLVGIIADRVAASGGENAEQLAMKAGLAVAALAPLCGTVVFGIIRRKIKKAGK